MELIGSYHSPQWGRVNVVRSTYGSATGPLAIMLNLEDGENLGVLSVNMYRPECSHDSADLPAGCFYVKTWSENTELAREAAATGMFVFRPDLPPARSGFVVAPVWQIKP